MDVTLPLADVQTAMLAGVRFAAFFMIAPPFAHRGIPGAVKAMLSVGLALAVLPRLDAAVTESTGAFVGALVLEAVVGAALGFLVSLVFSRSRRQATSSTCSAASSWRRRSTRRT